jgi:hypothetical protein
VETIFDHNVTDIDIANIFGASSVEIAKKHTLQSKDQDQQYGFIADLLQNRGEYKKAHEYAEKIKDLRLRSGIHSKINHEEFYNETGIILT